MGIFSWMKRKPEADPEQLQDGFEYPPGSALASVSHAQNAPPPPLRKAPKSAPRRGGKPPFGRVKAVQVVHRDLQLLAKPVPAGPVFTYSWGLRDRPNVGDWVTVENAGGRATAVIVALGSGPSAAGLRLSPVLGLVDMTQLNHVRKLISASEAQEAQDELVWLDLARKKAGLDATNALPSRVPLGFDPIPPKSGKIIGQKASDRGRVWWKIHKRAEALGRPVDEVEAFKVIANFWYGRGRMKSE